MSENTRIHVKATDDFDDPGRELIEVDGRTVGVFKIDGEFHALLNECAHEGGPVCKGEVRNELVAEPVEVGTLADEDFDGEKIVSCPWHGYTYDLETGTHIGGDDVGLETFDIVVEDDTVYIEI